MNTQTQTIPNLDKFSKEEVEWLLREPDNAEREAKFIRNVAIPVCRHQLNLYRARLAWLEAKRSE